MDECGRVRPDVEPRDRRRVAELREREARGRDGRGRRERERVEADQAGRHRHERGRQERRPLRRQGGPAGCANFPPEDDEREDDQGLLAEDRERAEHGQAGDLAAPERPVAAPAEMEEQAEQHEGAREGIVPTEDLAHARGRERVEREHEARHQRGAEEPVGEQKDEHGVDAGLLHMLEQLHDALWSVPGRLMLAEHFVEVRIAVNRIAPNDEAGDGIGS